MIYVTVGTHPQPFKRLVEAMDNFSAQSQEEIIVQFGATNLTLHHATGFAFCNWETAQNYMSKSRVIVMHAGGGSIMDAIKLGIPIIIWPRLARYHEHINDHQLQIANTLSRHGRAIVVNSSEELFAALSRDQFPLPKLSSSQNLIPTLMAKLDEYRNLSGK